MDEEQVVDLYFQTPELAIILFKQLGYSKNKIKRLIVGAGKRKLIEYYEVSKDVVIHRHNHLIKEAMDAKLCLSGNKRLMLSSYGFNNYSHYINKIKGMQMNSTYGVPTIEYPYVTLDTEYYDQHGNTIILSKNKPEEL